MIKFNSLVTLHYSISSVNNIIFESTFSSKPIVIRIGDGTLPRNLEMTLYGLTIGTDQTVVIEPKDAFGMRDENKNKTLHISMFPKKEMVMVGNVIEIDIREKDGKTGIAFAIIIRVDGENVSLDLNHPLAGHKIIFKVKVVNIDE